MVRFFRYTLVILALSGAILAFHRVYAQGISPLETPPPSQSDMVSVTEASLHPQAAQIASEAALLFAQIITASAIEEIEYTGGARQF